MPAPNIPKPATAIPTPAPILKGAAKPRVAAVAPILRVAAAPIVNKPTRIRTTPKNIFPKDVLELTLSYINIDHKISTVSKRINKRKNMSVTHKDVIEIVKCSLNNEASPFRKKLTKCLPRRT